MKMGFVFKLNLGLACILVLVALVTGVFFSIREASQVEKFLEKEVMVIAGLAATAVEAALSSEQEDEVQKSLQSFARVEGISYLYVLDSNGKEVASYTASGFTGNQPKLQPAEKEEVKTHDIKKTITLEDLTNPNQK